MNKKRKILCSVVCVPVLKIERQIKPTVPMIAQQMLRIDSIFSAREVVGTRPP